MALSDLYNIPEVTGQQSIDENSGIKNSKLVDYHVKHFNPNAGFSFRKELASDFGKSKYDANSLALYENQENDLNEYRYNAQSNWEMFGSAFASRAASIVPKVIGSIGTAAYGLGEVANMVYQAVDPNQDVNLNKSIQNVVNNPITQAMTSFDNSLKEALPVYGSRDGYNRGDLSGMLSSGKFWTEDLFDGLAFSVSAMIPGAGYAKAAQALGLVGKAASAASIAATTAHSVLYEAALEADGVNKAVEAGKEKYMRDKFATDPRIKEINAITAEADKYAPEMDAEGRPVHGAKEALLKKANDLRTRTIADWEDSFKKNKEEAAAATFKSNVAILALPDLLQSTIINRLFGKAEKGLIKSIKDGTIKAENMSAWKTALKDAGKSFISEGMEEGSQSAVSRYETERVFRDNKMDDRLASYWNYFADNMTMQGGQDSGGVILGGISGMLMGGLMAHRSARNEKKQVSLLQPKWEELQKYVHDSNMSLQDIDKSLLKTFGKIDKTDESGNIVGSLDNYINPETGKQEFDLDKIIKVAEFKTRDKDLVDASLYAVANEDEKLSRSVLQSKLGELFWNNMQKVDGVFFKDNNEAADYIKTQLDAMKSNNPDETTDGTVDMYKSTIDSMLKAYNESTEAVEKNTPVELANHTTINNYLTKALFYAKTQSDYFDKEIGLAKTPERRSALESLKKEADSIIEDLNTKDGVVKAHDAITQDIDRIAVLIDEINKEKANNESVKPASDDEFNKKNAELDVIDANIRSKAEEIDKFDKDNAEGLEQAEKELADLNEKRKSVNDEYARMHDSRLPNRTDKLNALEYELEETKIIHGNDNSGRIYHGLDFVKVGMNTDSVINEMNLGIRDRFLYNIGKNIQAKTKLKDMFDDLEKDNSKISEVGKFINENIDFVSKADVDKYISIATDEKNKFNPETDEQYKKLLSSKNEEDAMQEEMYGFSDPNSGTSQTLSAYTQSRSDDEIKKAELNDSIMSNYENAGTKRSKYNAATKDMDKYIRVEIAEALRSEGKSYADMVRDDIENYADKEKLQSMIAKLEKRSSAYTYNKFFSEDDTFNNIVSDYRSIIDDLNNMLGQVAANKSNKDALDITLERRRHDDRLSSIGITMIGGKATVTDSVLNDIFVKFVGDDRYSSMIKGLESSEHTGDSIHIDKAIEEARLSNKDGISTAIDSINKQLDNVSNSIKSIDLNLTLTNSALNADEEMDSFSKIMSFVAKTNPSRGISDINIFTIKYGKKDNSNSKTSLEKYKVHCDLNQLISDLESEINSGFFVLSDNQDNTIKLLGLTKLMRDANNMKNMSRDILTNYNQDAVDRVEESLLNDEVATNPVAPIVPTRQQRSTIRYILKWFASNAIEEASHYNFFNTIGFNTTGLDGSLTIQGVAGTGKTNIVAKWCCSMMVKLGSIDSLENVLALSNSKSNTLSVNSSIGINSSDKSIFELTEDDIQDKHQLLIVDEIGLVSLKELNALSGMIQNINERRASENKPLLRLLTFGDPNQITRSSSGSIISDVTSMSNGFAIEKAPTLVIPYRSNVSEISEIADVFQGRQVPVSEPLMITCTSSVSDNEVSPIGVNSVDSIQSFKDKVMNLLNNGTISVAKIVYNEDIERDELIEAFADVDQTKIDIVNCEDMQGKTIDNIFIYVKTDNALNNFRVPSISRYNTLMYTMISRATKYALVMNSNTPSGKPVFGENKVADSMKKNMEEQSKAIVDNSNRYGDQLSYELSTYGKQSSIIKAPIKIQDEAAIEQADNESQSNIVDDVKKQEPEEEEVPPEIEDSVADEEYSNEIDKYNSNAAKEANSNGDIVLKLEHPTSSMLDNDISKTDKKSYAREGNEVRYIRVRNGDAQQIHVVAKGADGMWNSVGVLSKDECIKANIDFTTSRVAIAKHEPSNVYDIKADAQFVSDSTGNILKGRIIGRPSNMSFVYTDSHLDLGDGLLSKVLTKLSKAFGSVINLSNIQGLKIYSKNDKSKAKNDKLYSGSHVYLEVKIPGSTKTKYIALSSVTFDQARGDRNLNLMHSLMDSISNIEDALGNYKFGSVEFNNFIHQFSKMMTSDNNFELPNTINIDSFDEYGKKLIAEMFNNNDSQLKDFYVNNAEDISTIISLLYKEKASAVKHKLSDTSEMKSYGLDGKINDCVETINTKIGSLISSLDNYDEEASVPDDFMSNMTDSVKKSIKNTSKFLYVLDNNKRDLLLKLLTSDFLLSNRLFEHGGREALLKELSLPNTKENMDYAMSVRDVVKHIMNVESPIENEKYGFNIGIDGKGVGVIQDNVNGSALKVTRLSKANTSDAQVAFDSIVRANNNLNHLSRPANSAESKTRNYSKFGRTLLATEVSYSDFKQYLKANLPQETSSEFIQKIPTQSRDAAAAYMINNGIPSELSKTLFDGYEAQYFITLDDIKDSIDGKNNVPLDMTEFRNISKDMMSISTNDSLSDDEKNSMMSDLIKRNKLEDRLKSNLASVRPSEITVSIEKKSDAKSSIEGQVSTEETAVAPVVEDIENPFESASISVDNPFDSLNSLDPFSNIGSMNISFGIQDQERTLLYGENSVSLQDSFTKDELKDADNRKIKCK